MHQKKKIIAFSITLLFLITLLSFGEHDGGDSPVKAYDGSVYLSSNITDSNYEKYLMQYDQNYPDQEIILDATNNYTCTDPKYQEEISIRSIHGVSGLYLPEMGDVSWDVLIPISGFYNIKIEYYAIKGRSSEISRGLLIDGEYPFTEAKNFVLSRIWEDAYQVDERREEGKHDSRPRQIEKERWSVSSIRDRQGYYDGVSYQFYLEEGIRQITFVADREPVVISTITFFQERPDQTYQSLLQTYQTQNYPVVGKASFDAKGFAVIQGEHAFEKSSPILSPVANWSSYKVDPYEKFITRYNTIGGLTWRVAGDWISWEIDVPESGLYELTFKVLQNYRRGMYSTRMLSINGQVPFTEARSIQFGYSSDWQNVTIGDEDGGYLFYLEEGKNVITLEATIGIYADIIRKTEHTIATLNTLYRKVVMIAGTNPDKYQDYMLSRRIEGLNTMIDQSIEELEFSISAIISIAGERSPLISSFERTVYQLKQFKKSERNIQEGLNELDDNISALGTWVMSISEQALSVDCIYLHGNDVSIPKATTNFFQKLWHEIVMLFGSYGSNTSLESSIKVDGPTITVWISSGRDQSQLLRQLIDDSFTAQHGINVNLKLVSATALLPATLSKNGPDVALGIGQNIPVNWGIRNALVDLSQFSDFEEVRGWFHESAVMPFQFRDAVYALPDTQDFLVSFVRTDISSELGLLTPATWKEVVDTLPTLQRQYLDYYLPNTKGALSTLMYAMIVQNGGQLYEEDGKSTLLAEPAATKAFIDFTTFFSHYGFEISANFPNRFRSGEMPMGIFNYSLYNTLSVFAPEIRGQWEFAELPGYVDEFGTINNSTASISTGSVILADSKKIDASWEFLKWWLGEDSQTGYGRGMEAILGAAARYPTANLEAFRNLPWSAKDYFTLSSQRQKAIGIPTVPGDYIIGRYIDNAFRATINNNTNPRDNLYEYTEKINIELVRKRQEFNLD